MELKDRLTALMRALPPAQRVGIVVGVIALAMAAVPFVMWITSPSYALLYGGMEDSEVAGVIDELESRGIPYRLEGSRILVPQPELHETRAQLAQAGVSATPTVPGYELLDEQALGTSDLRQRVDLQRALEGELSRTLSVMDGLETASVRLVLPEDQLFTDDRTSASASVLVRPRGNLDRGQIEAVALLVASSVDGLETDGVTVADTAGNVLHSPGDGSIGGGMTDGRQRRTQEFERTVAGELTQLVQQATGSAASVVVRADLDYDEVETETEEYEGDTAFPLRESLVDEIYEGAGAMEGGLVGVDGGPLAGGGGDSAYERSEATREFGSDRTVTRTQRAPGRVDRLSVAVVVDEGAVVTDAQLQELVGAAAGMEEERGDAFAITRVAMPAVDEALEEAGPAWVEVVQWGVALLVLLLVALGLFLMSRRRRAVEPPAKVVPAAVRPPTPEIPESDPTEALHRGPTIHDEVADLVERQPEEIAQLLRGWLADRRTVSR